MRRSRSQGFSLIELMIVVAVITVLSVLAVNAYRKFTARARATEVYAMFAEIRAKEESYRAEFASYLSVSASDTDFWPAPTKDAQNWYPPPNANWTNLGIKPPRDQLYCGYAVVAAPAGSLGTVANSFTTTFVGTLPGVPWWVATAMCDNDGVPGTLDSGTNASFITSSKSTVTHEDFPGR